MIEIKLNDFKVAMDKIITKIKKTQLEIFENANANVMDLYFYIGKIIYENSEYGNNFINKISIELKLKFPIYL